MEGKLKRRLYWESDTRFNPLSQSHGSLPPSRDAWDGRLGPRLAALSHGAYLDRAGVAGMGNAAPTGALPR